MSEEMRTLIAALEHTETYDLENALIELYIYIQSENEPLPQKDHTLLFTELSEWRDRSLGGGIAAYYREKGEEQLLHMRQALEPFSGREIAAKYLQGLETHHAQGDFAALDSWILQNEWNINDFLTELTR